MKSDTPFNQSSALVERFSVHSTDYYCLTWGHVLSDKGTFLSDKGDIYLSDKGTFSKNQPMAPAGKWGKISI